MYLKKGILSSIKPFSSLKFKKSDEELFREYQERESRRAKYIPRSMDLGAPELKGLQKIDKEKMEKFQKENSEFIPLVPWIEKNMYNWKTVKEYKGQFDYAKAELLVLQEYQKDILNHVYTPKENGKFPYSYVIWSQPKKHGKTQIAAAVGAWWSCIIESPNLILTLASNQEQSAGLIFKSAKPSLFAKGGKVPLSTNAKPEIIIPNGSVFQAIPNNYAGQAGGDYGLTLWSELWTYRLESDFRLFEELPPVPTRFNSVCHIETYAGFEDESKLLLSFHEKFFTDTKESQMTDKASPVPGLEHIQTYRDGRLQPACMHIPEDKIFMFWDHEIRATWIDDEYIATEKATTRHSTFIRLWENRWQSSEGTFITPELYADSITLDDEDWSPMVIAIDGSQRNDTTAIVGVRKRSVEVFGEKQDRYKVCLVAVYNPKDHKNTLKMKQMGAHKHDINLESVVGDFIRRLNEMDLIIGSVWYDPAQLHSVAMNLREDGIPCREFNQGPARLKADTFLWKLFNEGLIDIFPNDVLEEHCLSAKTKEYENEQIRLIKGTASEAKKIDAAVALSMACYRASLILDFPEDYEISTSFSQFDVEDNSDDFY